MTDAKLIERVAKAMYEALPAWEEVGRAEYQWPNVWPDVRLHEDIAWRHLAATALDEIRAVEKGQQARPAPYRGVCPDCGAIRDNCTCPPTKGAQDG